jgi:hypothetical protein
MSLICNFTKKILREGNEGLSQLKQLRCVLIARERLRQRKLSIASAVDSAWRWSVSVAIKNLGSHTHSRQSRASSAGDS